MTKVHWLRYKGRSPGERIVPSLCSPATVAWRVEYMKATYGVEAVEAVELDYMALDSGGMVVLSDPVLEVYVGEWMAICRLMHAHHVLRQLETRTKTLFGDLWIARFGGPNRIHVLLEDEAQRLYDGLYAAEGKALLHPDVEEPAPSLLAAFLPLEEADS